MTASCTWKRAFCPQIGRQLGISKQTVLNQLKRDGLRKGGYKGELADPNNYRLAFAPFGFSKKDGRLVPNKSELKICRLIVQLKNNSNFSFHEIAQSLCFVESRTGKTDFMEPCNRRSHLQTMERKTLIQGVLLCLQPLKISSPLLLPLPCSPIGLDSKKSFGSMLQLYIAKLYVTCGKIGAVLVYLTRPPAGLFLSSLENSQTNSNCFPI